MKLIFRILLALNTVFYGFVSSGRAMTPDETAPHPTIRPTPAPQAFPPAMTPSAYATATASVLDLVPAAQPGASPSSHPEISTFEHMETLLNRGIIHQADARFYSVQVFPRIVSSSLIQAPGFSRDTEGLCVSAMFQYMYDGFSGFADEDSTRTPLDRYLNLVKNARFRSTVLRGSVFAVEVTSADASVLPHHHLIPRRTRLLPNQANAQQVELAIRAGKRENGSILIGDRRIQRETFGALVSFFNVPISQVIKAYLNGDYTPNQNTFINRSLGLITLPPGSRVLFNYDIQEVVNKNIASHALVPFPDYVASRQGNPVKVLVGRGQLNSCNEVYNQASSWSRMLPVGYHPYTIDIDPRTIPHLLADITNSSHLRQIPSGSVDEVYLDGVTYDEVYLPHSGLYEVIGRILKVGGLFITNYETLDLPTLLENGLVPSGNIPQMEDYFGSRNARVATKQFIT